MEWTCSRTRISEKKHPVGSTKFRFKQVGADGGGWDIKDEHLEVKSMAAVTDMGGTGCVGCKVDQQTVGSADRQSSSWTLESHCLRHGGISAG